MPSQQPLRIYPNGEVLKNSRKAAGFTQSAMATFVSLKLGEEISEAAYQRYESGSRSIPVKVALMISKVVDVPPAILFIGSRGDISFGMPTGRS